MEKQAQGDLVSASSGGRDQHSAPVARKSKRYHGEEAERVTWRDCRAANELAAKMLAGQIDPMSIVVEAPKNPLGVVVE